mmetsp:Transcript_30220/g.72533  ORF Transcript_30220/g.72533 Transcript_30220/m.72533 type:complete len:460 (-) Transcript_30220:1490-2869(-)
MDSETLPVIIAGAGPCGLVAALVLQNHSVPFLILEKASRSKLCSNAGAGFDLAPTALNILIHRLGLSKERIDGMLSRYERWYIATVHGDLVKDEKTPQSAQEDYACAHRSAMQQALLDQLLQNAATKESEFLKCNTSLEYYQEEKDQVKVVLNDGSILVGKALLGCDGINSKVRSCMNEDEEDPLQYLGTTCYWGKCPPEAVKKGKDANKYDSDTFVWLLGTKKVPGSFFVTPSNGMYLWVLGVAADNPPSDRSDDLTRRGGGVLSETAKTELLNTFNDSGTLIDPVLETMISGTPANEITEAGLFDRVNLDLPYSSPGKRVALLGDSAHPQSPYLGQGTNCAITDAYVLATKLAEVPTQEAIADYDSEGRREEMKNLIVKAREQGSFLNSKNWFECWILRTILRYAPIDVDELKRYDGSNKNMVSGIKVESSNGGMAKSILIAAVAVAVFAVGFRVLS